MYLQAYTLYSSVRPFGVSSIFGAVDKNGPQLYMIEPSGLSYGHRATAVGKGKMLAKTAVGGLIFKLHLRCDTILLTLLRVSPIRFLSLRSSTLIRSPTVMPSSRPPECKLILGAVCSTICLHTISNVWYGYPTTLQYPRVSCRRER